MEAAMIMLVPGGTAAEGCDVEVRNGEGPGNLCCLSYQSG